MLLISMGIVNASFAPVLWSAGSSMILQRRRRPIRLRYAEAVADVQDQFEDPADQRTGGNSPFTIPMLIATWPAALFRWSLACGVGIFVSVTACATSNNAIGEYVANHQIRRRRHFSRWGAEASIVEIGVAGFSA